MATLKANTQKRLFMKMGVKRSTIVNHFKDMELKVR